MSNRRCARCSERLPESNTCGVCRNRCVDRTTWYGTDGKFDVGTFVMSRRDSVTVAFKTGDAVQQRNFEMKVTFDDEHRSTARFFVPITEELNLSDIVCKFTEIIDDRVVYQINHLRLYCNRGEEPAGTFINTPKYIASKRAVINVQCVDDVNCFQYAILAGMNVVASVNRFRPSVYKPHLHLLQMDGIPTPVPLSSVGQFENQNPDISVNVLFYNDDRDIVAIHTSEFCSQRKYHVNILMLTDHEKFHYVYVSSIARLFAHLSKHHCKAHVCQYCLRRFCKYSSLKKHACGAR